MGEDMQGHGYVESSESEPWAARPFFKVGVGVEREWLFGAVRYLSAGAISKVEVFGWAVYLRVGSVRKIAGVVFGRSKANA